MPPFLTPDEVSRFRALFKSAGIVLLMLRLDHPIGAREMADILGLDEHTVAKHLRALAQLNLVARTGRFGGYILLDGSQLILGSQSTVKNLQSAPTTTTTRYIDIKKSVSLEVVVDPDRTVKNLQSDEESLVRNRGPDLSPTEQALQDAGIGEPKRGALARLPHITPEYVHAWEGNLKQTRGKRYTPGLLIHVLESGDPSPPVNGNGHHPDCDCKECRDIKYRTCWYCKSYPCTCPAEAEEEGGEDED